MADVLLQSWADAIVFAHPTHRHFGDAMDEDATVLETALMPKTRHVTDAKFRVF